ncbi:MAG: FkbM family methyltransferase [Proteobacteria bacterium]|nr:FkbM family methyltransferase [Pseudomonadota bacterium]
MRFLQSRVSGRYNNDGMAAYFRAASIDAWVCHPLYERATRAWLDAALSGKVGVMIDVGAYCGSFCLRHRDRFQRVYAFEPFPDNYQALVTNLALSHADEIVPVNLAAGDKSGRARLYLGTPGTQSLLPTASGAHVEVEAVTLDDFTVRTGIDPLDVRLIKIDVEGAELYVLRGAECLLSQGAPLLVLEANTNDHARKLREYLGGFGFVEEARLDNRNFIFRKSSGEAYNPGSNS